MPSTTHTQKEYLEHLLASKSSPIINKKAPLTRQYPSMLDFRSIFFFKKKDGSIH